MKSSGGSGLLLGVKVENKSAVELTVSMKDDDPKVGIVECRSCGEPAGFIDLAATDDELKDGIVEIVLGVREKLPRVDIDPRKLDALILFQEHGRNYTEAALEIFGTESAASSISDWDSRFPKGPEGRHYMVDIIKEHLRKRGTYGQAPKAANKGIQANKN